MDLIIGSGLRIIAAVIESTPLNMRMAQLLVLFWVTWPLFKLGVPKAIQGQIEELVKGIKPPDQSSPEQLSAHVDSVISTYELTAARLQPLDAKVTS